VIGKGRRKGEPAAHGFEFRLQEQRLGHRGGQFVRALLQRFDFLRIHCGNVILFGRILCDVIEFDSLRQRGAPDELPVALADAGAEWLDVVDGNRNRAGAASTCDRRGPGATCRLSPS